jgi:hypothetical protein
LTGQEGRDRTGWPGQDSQGQDNQDRTARTGLADETARTEQGAGTGRTVITITEQLEPDNHDGPDSINMRDRIGAQQDRTAVTRWSGEGSKNRQSGQDSQNRTAVTG